MAKTVLQTKNLIKTYTLGNTTINAVNDVSIQINEGELVAIIGKSGSGKSTLMHLIGLLDTPTSGEISLNNKQTHNLNDKQLAKIRSRAYGGWLLAATGLISLAFGIFLLSNPVVSVQFLTVLVGLYILISGVFNTAFAFEMRAMNKDIDAIIAEIE